MDLNAPSQNAKKRRSTDGNGSASELHCDRNGQPRPCNNDDVTQIMILQQIMERMEQTMNRMENRLSSVDKLERRCERLEATCSSILDHVKRIDTTMGELDSKMDTSAEELTTMSKSLKYQEMMTKNQAWEYSAPMIPRPLENSPLAGLATQLKDATILMRRGNLDYLGLGDEDDEIEAILLDPNLDEGVFEDTIILHPHWGEFCRALSQFKYTLDILPDDVNTGFVLNHIEMSSELIDMLKGPLSEAHFKTLTFNDNNFGRGEEVYFLESLLRGNQKLEELVLMDNPIDTTVAKSGYPNLFEIIHKHNSLKSLTLNNCSEGRNGYVILKSLLPVGGQLSCLEMSTCQIQTEGNTFVSDFLATNPCLRMLDLRDNRFDDNDAILLAVALKTNSNLRHLDLAQNNISHDVGIETFCRALFDESSLNAAARSNHNCMICLETGFERPVMTRVRKLSCINGRNDPKINRRRKLYRVLESRNKYMTNCQDLIICQSNTCQKCLSQFRRMAGNLRGQGLQGHQQYQLFMKCCESGMSHLLCTSHWVVDKPRE